MVSIATPFSSIAPHGTMLGVLFSANNSAQHGYLSSADLVSGRNVTRNLADIVHHLTLLHGRQPGVVDHAALHTAQPVVREWLLEASTAFVRERSYLTKLTVAIGPLPSTPGQAETESAVLAQRHALEMLAQSDRIGCAFGAAASLVLDWANARTVLDSAAKRLGVESPECLLPCTEMTHDAATALAETPAIERALSFGAQQLLNQHRGLWDLMQARQIARGDD
jgi:hypothetical protein